MSAAVSSPRPSPSEQLRRIIRENGRSAYALGKASGVGRDLITRFLNGQTSLTLDTIDRLAPALALDFVRAGGSVAELAAADPSAAPIGTAPAGPSDQADGPELVKAEALEVLDQAGVIDALAAELVEPPADHGPAVGPGLPSDGPTPSAPAVASADGPEPLAIPLPPEATAEPADVPALDSVADGAELVALEGTGEKVETGRRPDFLDVATGDSPAPTPNPEPVATDSQLSAEALADGPPDVLPWPAVASAGDEPKPAA